MHRHGPGHDPTPDDPATSRALLRRLTDLRVGEVAAAQLVLSVPRRLLARAVDTFELLGDEARVDAGSWIAAAVEDPERVDAVLGRRRGWDAWLRMHRAWDATDAARAEQERRSHGWGAAISEALDDGQLRRAVERISGPIGVLGRRSLPVTRAHLLAWAVAVHDTRPGRAPRGGPGGRPRPGRGHHTGPA